MYGRGSREWEALIASPPRNVTAIANLGNGPGNLPDANAQALLARARARGIRVVGYVYTRYSSRPLREVERDVDRWERWYPIDGIFVDNVTSNGSTFAYYRKLSEHIRSWREHLIVMNGWVKREFMSLMNVNVSFEGSFTQFVHRREQAWTAFYAPHRLANIVYGVPDTASMRKVLQIAARRTLGTLFVTQADYPSPYFELPSFLRSQDRFLARQGC
jgi:hypothetical protein